MAFQKHKPPMRNHLMASIATKNKARTEARTEARMSSFISDSKKRKTNMTSLKSQPKRIKKSATNYNYNNISFLVVHHLRKQQIPSNNYIKFTLSENLKNYREIQQNDLLLHITMENATTAGSNNNRCNNKCKDETERSNN